MDFVHFLVGIDERGLADHAAVAAATLAAKLRAEVKLVHAVPVPPVLWFGVAEEERRQLHAEELGRAEHTVRERLSLNEAPFGLRPGALVERLEVIPGNPAHVLLSKARELGSSILFLGPHEQRHQLDFGSTTRAVLHETPCSLWTQPGAFRPVHRILVPTDLSGSSQQVFTAAARLADLLEVEITVLHCCEPFVGVHTKQWPLRSTKAVHEETRKAFESSVRGFDWGTLATPKMLFSLGQPIEEILSHQAEDQLIVMGSHGRTGLAKTLLGNVAYSVLRHAEAPVLVLRQLERTWLL